MHPKKSLQDKKSQLQKSCFRRASSSLNKNCVGKNQRCHGWQIFVPHKNKFAILIRLKWPQNKFATIQGKWHELPLICIHLQPETCALKIVNLISLPEMKCVDTWIIRIKIGKSQHAGLLHVRLQFCPVQSFSLLWARPILLGWFGAVCHGFLARTNVN